LIVIAASKIREKRIGRPERISVPRRHIENRVSGIVPLLAQERREKREPVDAPVIRHRRYRRLQKDLDGQGILSMRRRLIGLSAASAI